MQRVARVLVGCMLVAGCQYGVWVGSGPRVAVFGDSLTYFAETDGVRRERILTEQLAADGWSAYVSSWVLGTSEDVERLRRHRSVGDELDVVIVAIGTNDLLSGFSLEQAEAHLRATIEGVPCVRFVEPADAIPGLDDWRVMLDEVIADHADAARLPQPAFPTVDGIHHTIPEGTAMYRDLIASAVETCQEP